ncbi:MAG: hypothetical protein ILA34_08115 [Bacteroidaceae bacterium]|nr:hypothetical protein [Bacteroidaceae bacterium]
MKHLLSIILLVCILACGLSSCDDGNLTETYNTTKEGKVAKLNVGLATDAKTWANGYTLAFAAFSETSDYAILLKYIRDFDNGKLNMTLSNIPDSTSSVELCMVNRLRQRVVTFLKVEGEDVTAAGKNDTIRIEADNINLGMFEAIQQKVFNTTCVNCHGGSNFVAANLNLTEGKSYDGIVNHPSTKVSGMNIVEAGDATNSVLFLALTTSLSKDDHWLYDHTQEVVRERMQKLFEDWINAGAKK